MSHKPTKKEIKCHMLAVKGMEMPKSCEECPFYTYYAGIEEADCRITGEDTYNVKSGEKHEKCPLRLVNIDGLMYGTEVEGEESKKGEE